MKKYFLVVVSCLLAGNSFAMDERQKAVFRRESENLKRFARSVTSIENSFDAHQIPSDEAKARFEALKDEVTFLAVDQRIGMRHAQRKAGLIARIDRSIEDLQPHVQLLQPLPLEGVVTPVPLEGVGTPVAGQKRFASEQ